MVCPLCNEYTDKPHCPSPSCPWKNCTKCGVDISKEGKYMEHRPYPGLVG